MYAANGQQCNPGDILIGRDEDFIYCVEAKNLRKVQESIAAIAEAASTPGCYGGDFCNFFVARIGERLNIPYFQDVWFPNKKSNVVGGPDETRKANEIYDFLRKATASKASGWREVSAKDAQEFANQGDFVIGVAKNHDPARSGHVAIVAPAWLEKEKIADDRGGPWVRDSRSPNVSVRAGIHRFISPEFTKPIWVRWKP
jgi:hypothetical protein